MTPQQAAAHYGAGGNLSYNSSTNLPTHDPPRQYDLQHTQTPANGAPSATSQDQQMAFGQNAALPGLDLSILQGITPDQLALIARLIQTGTLPLPPGAPSNQVSNAPTALAPADPPVPVAGLNGGVDREEGEVDEGEASEHQPRDFLSTPPKGPRQRNRSPTFLEKKARGVVADLESQSSSRRGSQRLNVAAPFHAPRGPSALSNGQPNTRATNGAGSSASAKQPSTQQPSIPTQGATLKEFVLELHNAGYGFEDMAKEVGNTSSLRRLYQSLQLAVPILDNAPAAHTNGSAAPVVSEPRPSPAVKRPVSKPAPADRSAYLAKLQAAKNKKLESVASAHPNELASPLSQPAIPAKPIPHAVETRIEPPVPQAAPPKKAANTELIRQRLEALRAKQNAQLSMSDPVPATNPFQENATAAQSATNGTTNVANARAEMAISTGMSGVKDQLVGAEDVQKLHSEPVMQSIPTSASPSISRGYGLPGLFTTRASATPTLPTSAKDPTQTPEAARSRSNQSPVALSVPFAGQQSHNVGGIAAPSRQNSATQQPFGHCLTNESFIIEASSDEEDDREDEQAPDGRSSEPRVKQPPPGKLQDFPPKHSALASAGASTPGTPSVDLKRKLEEVEEMKRKIARFETRKTKSKSHAQAVKAAGGDSSESSIPDSGSATPAAKIIQLDAPATLLAATPAKMGAAEQEKEALRRRLLELQAQGVALQPPNRALAQSIPPAVQPQKVTEHQNGSEMEDGQMEEDDFYENESSDTVASNQPDLAQSQDVVMTNSTESANELPERSMSARSIDDGELGNADQLALGSEKAAQPQYSSTSPGPAAVMNDENHNLESRDDDDDMDDVYEPQPDSVTLPTMDANPTESDSADYAGVPISAKDVVEVIRTIDVSPDDAEDDGDDYEPSQNIETANEVAAQSPVSTDAMSESVAMSESEESTSAEQSAAQSPEVGLVTDLPPNPDAAVRVVDDGLAPELQPTPKPHVDANQQPQAPAGFYKPYISPLAHFKDFRFHPSFLETVPGGHKSLSFSHKIDPIKQLCPYEVGGRCNDKSCGFQHFRTMDISDNDLLRILGTERMPASDPETEKKWRDGLTAVVKELRTISKTQDVDVIARRIAEFRREFIGDPTKTLFFKNT